MCGITGHLSTHPIDDKIIERMTDALAHRGPDGRGIFRDRDWNLSLGHRRLSIIDIKSGGQPMRSPCGRYVIVFNGEIYNYRELRKDLAKQGSRFRTDSDTEVLLDMYRVHGEDACRHLNGMFAFAIADLHDRSLFLARDPIGEKPLVYYADAHCFAFASELKSLLALPTLKRRVDPVALHHFLSLNYVPGDLTMLEGVKRLPPGSWLRARGIKGTGIKGTGIKGIREKNGLRDPSIPQSLSPSIPQSLNHSIPTPYYHLPVGPQLDITLDEAAARLDALLDDAVRLRLRSDVPVGVFLSSGIDSSLIASSVARVANSPVTAFTMGFDEPGFDESVAAAETARRLGLPHETAVANPDAAALFSKLVWHADDPLADSSALPVYHLCRMTAQHVKVALGGDGADELFAGYLTHRATLLAQRYRRYLPTSLRNIIAAAARLVPAGSGKVSFGYKLRRFTHRAGLPTGPAHLAFNGAWLEQDKRQLYTEDWSRRTAGLDSLEHLAAALNMATEEGLKRSDMSDGPTWSSSPAHDSEISARSLLSRILAIDQRQYLPDDILAKADRMSMAHGLEVRSPYLDPRIVQFAATLSDSVKLGLLGRCGLGGSHGKRILRRLAARRGLTHLAGRRKQGFSIPIHDWLRGPLRPTMLYWLSQSRVEETGVFNSAAVQKRVEAHLSSREEIGFELWGLMVFMVWHERFIRVQSEAPPLPQADQVRPSSSTVVNSARPASV